MNERVNKGAGKEPVKKQRVYNSWTQKAVTAFCVVLVLGSVMGCAHRNAFYCGNATNNGRRGVVRTNEAGFDGACGIEAIAQVEDNAIGFPQLSITVTNITNREIAAIRFCAIPYDGCGKEIQNWANFYTDTPIAAGQSSSIYFQFIDESIQTVKLYVYSVSFSDGTEWGDKDGDKSVILEHGEVIRVLSK